MDKLGAAVLFEAALVCRREDDELATLVVPKLNGPWPPMDMVSANELVLTAETVKVLVALPPADDDDGIGMDEPIDE